ncbi:protein turtle-like [Palaemon carinicauda]|uniref:protein turtle-like n=1 Tax=Palaemon carinicauda TaxID=392227 RepID=UPI0035B584C5
MRWHLMLVYGMMTLLSVLSLVEMKQIPVVKVTGLIGKSATLPCDISHPPDDTVYLLLFFKDGLTTPIYRFDDRSSERGKDDHWSDIKVLGSRATLDVTTSPALLRLTSLRDGDQGLYKCRVDFKLQPTKTTRVNLTVVTPPESVSVIIHKKDGHSTRVTNIVGPYTEGDILKLTCIAHGGKPRPSVVWFEDTHLLDSHMESEDGEKTTTQTPPGNTTMVSTRPTKLPPSSGSLSNDPHKEQSPKNTLILGPLTRSDLKLLLTCEAANNNITLPISVVVMVEMNLPPLLVVIRSPKLPLIAEKEYKVVCEVVGSRPPPTITWWTDDQRVLQAIKTTSADGNITRSTLHFPPRPQDDGTALRCIAENHATDTRIEDTWNLTVQYIPKATASFGSSLNEENIKEGDDVYFECSILANPKVSHVSWRHNNEVLSHNISGGIIISNQSLVLQKVSKAQAGRYSCHAHNVIGDGSSNTLRLDVKYSPVCSPGQLTTYPVGKYEDAEVTCSVQANPLQASFQWTFNNTADTIDVPQGRFTSSSSHSVITYTPMTSLDYGTLLCWASNEIGTQGEPCIFHIVPAGKPDPPLNCTVNERTQVSVKISCEEGSSGGLTQTFVLEASLQNGRHTINVTSPEPSFSVNGLQPGEKYKINIRAKNEKGFSVPTYLTIWSLSDTSAVYQPHDGPSEAEVRDGGKNGSGAENHQEKEEKNNHQELAEPTVLYQLLPIILGLGGGLLIVSSILLLFLLIRSRRQRPRCPPPAPTSLGHVPRGILKSPIISPKHICKPTPADGELQVESESDADPDVIPLHESFYGAQGEVSTPATLLPPDSYKYTSLPVSFPHIVNQSYSRLPVSPSVATISSMTEGGNTMCAKGEANEAVITSPYNCQALLTEQLECLDPAHHLFRSSTLPRASSVSSPCSRGTVVCGGQQLNPHICPPPGLEGGPSQTLVSQNTRIKGPTAPMVSSPNAYDDDTPTTPLLGKRESSV